MYDFCAVSIQTPIASEAAPRPFHYIFWSLFRNSWIKPEPDMLKVLPIIPSSTSHIIYPLFFFYSYIITYHYHFVLIDLYVSGINIQKNMDLIYILL